MATKQGFASILDSLRTVDDSFSFTIDGGEQDGERIPMADSKLLIGLDRSERRIAWEPAQIQVPCLVVSKDWGGIEIAATGQREILVNGSVMKESRRLRHGDRLRLSVAETGAANGNGVQPQASYIQLLFQEPVSLSILDAMSPPKSLPSEPADEPKSKPASVTPPVEPAEDKVTEKAAAGEAGVLASSQGEAQPETASGDSQQRYLGYFTLNDLSFMTFGTLILSLIMFLALLYMTRAVND